MLFNSLHFAFFFPVVLAGHWSLGPKARPWWLLAASVYFYAAYRPAYLLVLGALILVDYYAALALARRRGTPRVALLWVSVALNMGALGLFKYHDFAVASLGLSLPPLGWELPLGLSFHTFQSLGYVIDVYRGREPERDLRRYALFVMFWPQLVAGPIERASGLLAQLAAPPRPAYADAVRGLQLMAWGFFLKLAVGDRLAPYASAAYADPRAVNGAALLVGTVFFAFQIYADFCGYSLIAIGAARAMGYRLAVNFSAPYFAASLADFWRRWHVSLSSWFRDYLYFPLGGSRVPFHRELLNLLVVFALSGLWHGASWTFVAWGLWHGLGLCAERAAARAGVPAPPRWVRVPLTFAFVTAGWVFFRAASLEDAFIVFFKVARADLLAELPAALRSFDLPGAELVFALAGVAATLAVDLARRGAGLRERVARLPAPARWAFYYAAVAALLLLGRFDERPFIYFQF
ncbi:MAG: MBOAT family O-acyltransferase [Elusimicrobiota bacterium]|nr:MBOAT family O-acyltransferase [Elusimicrobiota bacterium]